VKEGIEKDEESMAFTKDDLKKQVKAIFASNLYSPNDFYKVIFKDDEAVLEALKVLKNQKDYNKLLVSTQH
jgi:carboxyl-terminal processing protease